MATAAVRTPTQSRAKRTRSKLVRAAQVEFSARGYAHTTAASIAQRAEVATGTFYQYFRDKDAVLHELAVDRLRAIGERVLELMQKSDVVVVGATMREEIVARMGAVVQAVVDYHREDPGLHAVLTERRHADPELERLTSESERALVGQIAELLRGFGQHTDRKAVAFVLFGMVEGAVHAHVMGQALVSDARMNRALVEAMVKVALPTSEDEAS